MLKRASRTIVIFALTTLVGCNAYLPPATPPTSIPTPLRIHSTSAASPLLESLSLAYSEQHPGSSINNAVANHATLVQRLRGDPGLTFLSNHLPQNVPVWAAPIAQDGLAIIVHPSNPVRNLTIEELRRLYRGYTTNWQELRGADLNVMILSSDTGSDLRAEFERLVMGQERTTPNARLLPSINAVLAEVAQNPGAIGYIPLSQNHTNVATITINDVQPTLQTVTENLYPLRTVIYIIGAEEPVGGMRDFVGWAQGAAGQASFAGQFAPLP
ncbi:MAG: substrate-binding domain-containing protein [Anaerolineae bacterium]|nr:substrate-binding domain-containing protein [Anaerolineae bacterium]